jgi:hypothetical protein
MKENLVAAALKLQVAGRIIHEDETTISALRKDAAEAKKQYIIATKKEAEAAELIDALRVEVSLLKRQLREKTDEASSLFATSAASLTISDAEVDQMFARFNRPNTREWSGADGSSDNFSPSSRGRPMTSFQEWKLQKFIWSPDAPKFDDWHVAKEEERKKDLRDDAAYMESLVDDSMRLAPRRYTAANRQPMSPFGEAMAVRARSRESAAIKREQMALTDGGKRAQTTAGRRRNNFAENQADNKFPGITIRDRAATSNQLLSGKKSHFDT